MLVIRLSRPPMLGHEQSCSPSLNFCTLFRFRPLSAASVAQLLGQVISLIQGIQRVRETVHGYPKLFEGQFKQLDGLRHTLELVEQEKELQAARRMHEISQELHAFPDEIARWSIRITVR